jgi:hemoglobin
VPGAVFEAMGEERVFAFAEAFYVRLGRSRAAHLFPSDTEQLRQASHKTGALLVFLFGGPPRYQQLYGPPRLRMRHLPFEIDEAARLEWVRCFRETLAEAPERFGMPAEHVAKVDAFFDAFSRWMVNKA